MGLIENFIGNKVYETLFLDNLLGIIWNKIVELWQIGGSAIPGALVLLLLMFLIILISFIPLIGIGYLIYKLLKHWRIIQ